MMDWIVDWILRPQCAACGVPAVTLCSACRASLVELGPACPRCGEPTREHTTEGEGSIAGWGPRDSLARGNPPGTTEGNGTIAGWGPGDSLVRGNPPGTTEGNGSIARWVVAEWGPGDSPARASPCRRCANDPLPLDRVVAPWRFGGQLASAIRRLKFANRAHVARDVAPLWAPVLAAAVAEQDAVVVPVPLHWRRRCVRGYDHAWLLARHACAFAGIAGPVCALRRIRHAPAQSTLPAADRTANVRGAFAATRAAARSIAGRPIVLVDDVMTTGATLGAAARALRSAGATSITALVLARATSARE